MQTGGACKSNSKASKTVEPHEIDELVESAHDREIPSKFAFLRSDFELGESKV